MRAFSIVFNVLREADKDMKYLENLIFFLNWIQILKNHKGVRYFDKSDVTRGKM